MTDQSVQAPIRSHRLLASLLLCLIWALTAWLAVLALLDDLWQGGDPWAQGDWLVNLSAGLVRRGPFGEAMLWLADVFSISPVALVVTLQIALGGAVMLGLVAMFLKAGAPARLTLLLMAPLGLIYWGADPGVVGRKEVLGYAAALPLILSPNLRAGLRASLLLFAVAMLGHEVNAFFLPFLLAIAVLRSGTLSAHLPWSIAMTALAALGALFAGIYTSVPDAAPMCQRLEAFDLRGGICWGMIDWLGRDLTHNTTSVALLLERLDVTEVLTALALALAPIAPLIWPSKRKLVLGLIVLAALIALTPVYFLARDWGRWLSISVIGLTFLVLTAAIWRREAVPFIDTPPKAWMLIAVALLSLAVTVEHYTLVQLPGLVRVLF